MPFQHKNRAYSMTSQPCVEPAQETRQYEGRGIRQLVNKRCGNINRGSKGLMLGTGAEDMMIVEGMLSGSKFDEAVVRWYVVIALH
jgi:hypothetical protein